MLDHADFTARARQHELDHTDHTDQESMPCLEDLHHEVGIDGLFGVCKGFKPQNIPEASLLLTIALTGISHWGGFFGAVLIVNCVFVRWWKAIEIIEISVDGWRGSPASAFVYEG